MGSALKWTWLILQWPVALALVALALGIVFYFGPDADQDWAWITPGALLGSVLWLLVSLATKVYVANFIDYNAAYGSVGGVMVVLLWMYVSSIAILVAAELNAEIEHASPHGKAPGQKTPEGRRVLGARGGTAGGRAPTGRARETPRPRRGRPRRRGASPWSRDRRGRRGRHPRRSRLERCAREGRARHATDSAASGRLRLAHAAGLGPAGERVRREGAQRPQRREHPLAAPLPRGVPGEPVAVPDRGRQGTDGHQLAGGLQRPEQPAEGRPQDRRRKGPRIGADGHAPALDLRGDEVLQLAATCAARRPAGRRAPRRRPPPRGSSGRARPA